MRSTFRQIHGDLDATAMSIIDTMLRVSAAAILLALAPMHAHAAMRQDWTRPVLQIGKAEGQDAEILGRIGAVKVDASGNIFILDTQAYEVRWHGPDGGLRGRAGRSGEGPGEFRFPIAMALDSAGLVNVLDARNARISIFRPTAQGLAHVEDISSVFGSDLCILSNRRFVLNQGPAGLIHEIGVDGSVVRSFGGLEPVDQEARSAMQGAEGIQQEWTNRAIMACDPSTQSVVLLHQYIPLVRAFSPDGRERWRTTLTDYHAMRWERSPKSGSTGLRVAPDPTTGTIHNAVALGPAEPGRIVVTLAEGAMSPSAPQRIEIRFMDARTGREIERLEAPVAIAAVKRGRTYGYTDEPYPRVVVY